MPPRADYQSDEDESDDARHIDVKSQISALRETFFPPIRNLVHSLGGPEDVLCQDGSVERVYKLGDTALSCLRDLKRFWKLDESDTQRTIARIFYETKMLPNDLLPMLQDCVHTPGERASKIALAAADLIMAMTWPIDVIEELREAHLTQDAAAQKVDYSGLQDIHLEYKLAIVRAKAMPDLFRILLPVLEKSRIQRTQKDKGIISMILHLIRNVLAIKDKPTSYLHSSELLEKSTLQSELIIQMQAGSILDFLVTVAAHSHRGEFKEWNLITLDILHLITRNVQPLQLVQPNKDHQSSQLANLLLKEESLKKAELRKGATRHSRFGTTMTVTSGDKKYITHKQSAVYKSPSKILDEVKKGKKKKSRKEDELVPPNELTADAVNALKGMSMDFIDGGFNLMIQSILHDIIHERPNVQQLDTVRLLSISSFFTQYFLALKSQDNPIQQDREKNFGLIAAVTEVDFISWTIKCLETSLDEKPANWPQVHACVNCLIQIFLTIEALSVDPDEDMRADADILQMNLYRQETFLDCFVKLMSNYKDQSRKYLDSVMNLAYIFLRMLEKYSKTNVLRIAKAKKSRKRRQKNDADIDVYGAYDEEEVQKEQDRRQKEHAFIFDKFEARFACEPVLATCIHYLSQYPTFDSDEQMKRIISLMHRQAIKAKADGLYHKVSVFVLFRQIMDDHKSGKLARSKHTTELIKLLEYILRRFFKMASTNPLMVVEIFYPHRSSDIKKMIKGKDNYQYEEEEEHVQMPVEVAFRDEHVMSNSRKIGVAIAVLQERNEEYLLDWIKDNLRIVAAGRQEIVLSTDGPQESTTDWLDDTEDPEQIRARLEGRRPSEMAIAKFDPFRVPFETDEQMEAATRHSQLKLLLRTLDWEAAEDITAKCLRWSIPPSRLPNDIAADIRIIDHFLLHPLEMDADKNASDLLKKNAKRRRRAPEADGNLSDAERAIGASQKKPRKKRRKNDGSDSSSEEEQEAASQRRQKRKAEVIASFKSAQFVDSDEDGEDEERDRLFFEREQELRKQREAAMATASAGLPSQKPKQSKKSKNQNDKRKSKDTVRVQKKAKTANQHREKTPSLTQDDSAPSDLIRTPSSEAPEHSDRNLSQATEDFSTQKFTQPRRKIIADSDDE